MKTQEKDLTTAEIVKETNLEHIAIIMDGNRRWAKEKNLPSAMDILQYMLFLQKIGKEKKKKLIF